jgi:hypothetical protein
MNRDGRCDVIVKHSEKLYISELYEIKGWVYILGWDYIFQMTAEVGWGKYFLAYGWVKGIFFSENDSLRCPTPVP